MKQFLIIFSICLILLTAGCRTEQTGTSVVLSENEPIERASVTSYLGSTDENLSAEKGPGEATIYVTSGVETVMQRKYNEPLFDFDASVEYFYNSGSVYEIVAVFDGASREDVLANITAALGSPADAQEESDETQFQYHWELDGISYTMLHQPESSPTVIINLAE